jgi:hypothetical protein
MAIAAHTPMIGHIQKRFILELLRSSCGEGFVLQAFRRSSRNAFDKNLIGIDESGVPTDIARPPERRGQVQDPI